MDDSSALLLNSDCRDQSVPTSCPNTWKYLDSSDGYAWKADSDLKVACGKENARDLSSHQFLILETCNSTINNYFIFPKIVSDACCDAVAVSMSTDTNYPTNGEYSKQSSTQDTRTFYHNIQSNFYIYWSSEYNSWFVSILTLMIQ